MLIIFPLNYKNYLSLEFNNLKFQTVMKKSDYFSLRRVIKGQQNKHRSYQEHREDQKPIVL